MIVDPFLNSDAVAKWAAEVLSERGIDEVAKWRMLEYWVQVELYRAIEAGTAGLWRYLGEYEQPYFTDLPRSGSKTKTKWVDLVIAEPPLQSPSRIVWIELKDIGRSHHTLLANAKGLGNDFAALWSLRPLETQQTWLNPPDHAVDRGRLPEWDAYGPGILGAQHLIAQIVIVPKTAWQLISTADMESLWLGAFEQRTKSNAKNEGVLIARRDTKVFSVYAVVHQLPTKG